MRERCREDRRRRSRRRSWEAIEGALARDPALLGEIESVLAELVPAAGDRFLVELAAQLPRARPPAAVLAALEAALLGPGGARTDDGVEGESAAARADPEREDDDEQTQSPPPDPRPP